MEAIDSPGCENARLDVTQPCYREDPLPSAASTVLLLKMGVEKAGQGGI